MNHQQIQVGIVGYGNLGKGVQAAITYTEDMELAGIFTRRNPQSLSVESPSVPVYPLDELQAMKNTIDVLILCGGSATDLPEMTPKYAADFHVVDSFDTHAKIPEHFAAVDAAAKKGSKVAIISVGWDPGLFSLQRMMGQAILPQGTTYTFWGKGISQGHSDAVRHVEGVADARQYTIPADTALEQVRSGKTPVLSTREKHTRVCYVVAKEGADKARIEDEIITLPNYFADYDTTVHFISQEVLESEHGGLPHGGRIIHSGATGLRHKNNQIIEYTLALESNPEFTSSVLVAYARAAVRMSKDSVSGCKTIFDIPPAYLSPLTPKEMRKELL